MTNTGIIIVILLVWFWVWYDNTVRKPRKAREAEALKQKADALKREAEELRAEREAEERLRLELEAEEKAEARIRPARQFLWDSWVHALTPDSQTADIAKFRKMGVDEQIRFLVTEFGLSRTEAEAVFNQVENDIP
jgi:hypothetical protein